MGQRLCRQPHASFSDTERMGLRALVAVASLFLVTILPPQAWAAESASGSSQSAAALSLPNYTSNNCSNNHWTAISATQYLDMFGANDDKRVCPPADWFIKARGYFPQLAEGDGLMWAQGLVNVNPFGGCSAPGSNTDLDHDFTVPCQAHDYCYDLRGAGFSGTVSDDACDDAFWTLMDAHCQTRSYLLQPTCYSHRTSYYLAVRLPNVVTNPAPPVVEMAGTHNGKCLDIEAWGQNPGAMVTSYTCLYGTNQRFQIITLGDGTFAFDPLHSTNQCINIFAAYGWWLNQGSCSSSYRAFRIYDYFGSDRYSLRSTWLGNGWCVNHPSPMNGSWVNMAACNEASYQLFQLR